MTGKASTRRRFLGTTAATAIMSACPFRWVKAEDVGTGAKIKLRFAVASDLHYAQEGTPFEQMAGEMVGWINAEKAGKGLDALFLNGDLVNDSAEGLVALRDKHLSKLAVPYYCSKGNHDFVDQQPGSASESWEKVWGYPANHAVTIGGCSFLLGDCSAPAKSDVYLAADHGWLKQQLEKHRNASAVFVMIHIQQRATGVDQWPKHGVHDTKEIPKAEEVMKLLESTENVRAVFHGHNHLETGVYVSGERRYFFDSHVGGSWGAKRGYRIVEVYDDHTLVSYQVNAEDDVVLNRNRLDVAGKDVQ